MIRFKFYLYLLIFLLLPSFSFCQKVVVHAFMENKKTRPSSDTIYYDFNRNLAWKDFQGTPDANHYGGAVTASGFAFDSQVNFDGKTINLNIGVYSFFTKSDSWKKPEINSAYHLLHEQHHFDITRLGAQKFLAAIQQASFTKDNYNKLLTSLFENAYKENEAMQVLYDNETNHSINTAKQLEWNDKISASIETLKSNTAGNN